MTDRALAIATATTTTATTTTTTATATNSKATGHPRRTSPAAVPRWARFLGVALVPLDDDRDGSRRTWVLSAGAGTAHTVALLVDDPNDH
jgi:hypothetical protein